MKQEINLYLAVPRKIIIRLPARVIVYISIAFLAFLLLIALYTGWQRVMIGHQFAEVDVGRSALVKELNVLQKTLVNKQQSSPLRRQIALLANQFSVKSKLVSAYQGQSAQGFAQYLKALSQSIVSGVWLTRIIIQRGGKNITLMGHAYDMSMMTAFLQNLGKTDIGGLPFKIKKVEQSGDEKLKKLSGRTQVLTFELAREEGFAG